MSSRARRTRRPSAAAASQPDDTIMNEDNEDNNNNNNNNNDHGSVASVGSHSTTASKASRASARLKRKRDSVAAAGSSTALTQPRAIPKETADPGPHERPPRSAKRQRTVKPYTPSRRHPTRGHPKGDEESATFSEDDPSENDNGDTNTHQNISIPTEIETKPGNGHGDHKHQNQQPPVDMDEEKEVDNIEKEDGKLPAVGENGHHASSSSQVASAVDHVELLDPLGVVATTIPLAVAESVAAEPRIMSQQTQQQEQQQQPQSQSSLQLRDSDRHVAVAKPTPVSIARVREPEENGAVALPPMEPRPWGRVPDRVVEWTGPVWTVAYETTTAVVVVTADMILKLYERTVRRADDSDGEMEEEAVGVPVPAEMLRLNQPSPWDRTGSWIVLLLFLQVLASSLGVNPILNRTAAFSDILLRLYSRGNRGPGSSQLLTVVEMSASLADDRLDDRIREQLSKLQQRQTELGTLLDIQDAAQAKIDYMVEQLQEALTEKRENFNQAHSFVAAALQDLQLLMGMDTHAMLLSPQFSSLSAHWDQSGNSTAIPLIDTSRLELWKIVQLDSDENDDSVCASNLVGDQDGDVSRLNRKHLEEFLESLSAKVSDAAAVVQQEPDMISSVRQWIRAILQNETGVVRNDSEGSLQTYGKGSGSEGDMAQLLRWMQLRFEEEMADQTGTWDFASISNGAQVIQSKTSPSLVDSLPIVNRIASLLGLRFYGHGPQAALTPTYPPFALGQCWSFLDQTNDDTPDSMFGVLTVRLAQPIVVESVLVEHPPEDVARYGVRSAIREFYIQGFEEADASGEAWELGSFEFNIGPGAPSRQEFEVYEEIDGEDVPVLRAVRLQIKSNWGGEYACLYRFRVHGYVEEEDEAE